MYLRTIAVFSMFVATTVQAETCNATMHRSAPDSRYAILATGVEVMDTRTGLIWQRCSLGQFWNGNTCTGNAHLYSWTEAFQAAKNSGFSWRVPDTKELQSLVEEACYSPSINGILFPGTPFEHYWTSTPDTRGSGRAWVVDFGFGITESYPRNLSYNIRLVRSGQ
jgi:hypothetical protein